MTKKGDAVSIQMIPLTAILPNKHRKADKYVLDEGKIEALLQSYATSQFWDGSIQARPHPKKEGKYEIAFGHHRVEACNRFGYKEIGLVVAPRTDADMLKMMGDENRGEFKHDGTVGIYTIEAVIDAYSRGEIGESDGMMAPDEKTPKHSVFHVAAGGATYTCSTVARFLGWTMSHGERDPQPTSACRVAFDAYQRLASIEAACLSLDPELRFDKSLLAITKASRAAETEAKRLTLSASKIRQAQSLAAKNTATCIQERGANAANNLAVGIGKHAAQNVSGPKEKRIPSVEVYIARLINTCETLAPYEKIGRDCLRLMPYVKDIDSNLANRLADALQLMLDRTPMNIISLCKALRSGDKKRIAGLLEEKYGKN